MNMYLYQHKYFKYLNIFYLVLLLKVTDGMRHLLHHGTHLPKYDQKTNSFHVQFATRSSAHVEVWPHTNTPITKIIPPLSSWCHLPLYCSQTQCSSLTSKWNPVLKKTKTLSVLYAINIFPPKEVLQHINIIIIETATPYYSSDLNFVKFNYRYPLLQVQNVFMISLM